MECAIRAVEAEDPHDSDVQAITRIYNEAIGEGNSTADIDKCTAHQRLEWIKSHTPRDEYPVVVAETVNGQIAGFASLSRFHTRPGYDGVAEVSYYVASEHRGCGLGNQLLTWLENAAQRQGLRKLTAIIFTDNAASIALMNKHDFTQYGLLEDAARNDKLSRKHDVSYWYKNID